MFISRHLSPRIKSLASHFPSLVVTGARQVGKTTLIKKLFPDYSYVTLDSIPDAELADNSPDLFFEKYPPPVFIDEVQYAPSIFRHLKVRIDRQHEQKGQYILTGSQKFVLMKGVSESLAGRCGMIEMESLSAGELKAQLDSFLKDNTLEDLLVRGFFPELWKIPDFPYEEFYKSYINTYIERDVRQIINISSTRSFNQFLRALTARSGQILNKSDIAKDLGISTKTISNWLSIMEASNQITILEPYYSNLNKRLVKSPKIYLNDTGMLCFLLGLDGRSLVNYHGVGHIWEAFVVSELRKLLSISFPQAKLFFYRDKDGKEVDIILELGGKIHLLEVKWTQIPDSRMLRTLQNVADLFGRKAGKRIIVCRTDQTYQNKDGIIVANGLRISEEIANLINS